MPITLNGSNGVTFPDNSLQVVAALASGAVINAPSGTALTLTNTSAQSQIVQFTSVADSIINLPNATTLTTKGGPVFRLINNSQCGASVFVRNASGTTIATIPVLGIVDVTLEDNATAAGTWVFSAVEYNRTPTFYASSSATTTAVSMGGVAFGGTGGYSAIQLSDSSFIFYWIQTGTNNLSAFVRAVGATLSGNTFSFGTPVNGATVASVQISTRICYGFRLNATTAILDMRISNDDAGNTTVYGYTYSMVATISGNTVTLGGLNQNNTPTLDAAYGQPSTRTSSAMFGPVKCRISDTAFATIYQTGAASTGNWQYGGSGNLACTITTVSGTTQTNGTAVTIAANLGQPMAVCSHANNAFVLSYYTVAANGSSPGIRKVVVASVSGTTPTFGTPISIDASNINCYKDSANSNFRAVAFSSTRVWLPMYRVVSGETDQEALQYYGICTISGNTATFVPNSIIKIPREGGPYEFNFAFEDSNSILVYNNSTRFINKITLNVSNIPYVAEKYEVISDVQNGSALAGTNWVTNFAQGSALSIYWSANPTTSTTIDFSTIRVTNP